MHDYARVIVGLGAVGAHAVAAIAQDKPERDPVALAIVTAMELHEQRIKTLAWHQQVFITLKDGKEFMISESDQASDITGPWAWKGVWAGQEGEKQEWKYHESQYGTLDGVTYWGRSPELRRGILRPSDGERDLYRSPEQLLGRRPDRIVERSLWDALRDAESIQVTSHEGSLWRLHAVTAIVNVNVTVDIEADASRDFARTEYVMGDVLWRAPYCKETTTRFEPIAGIDVPVEGVTTWWCVDIPPNDLAAFDAEMMRQGITERGDPRDPAYRRACWNSIDSVFGEKGVPTKVLGVGPMRLVCSGVRVNEVMDSEVFAPPFGAQEMVFNTYTGQSRRLADHTPNSRPVEHDAPAVLEEH